MPDTKSTFNFQSLKAKWPSAVVARSKVGEFTGGLVSPGTLANEDSRGTGPKERFVLGRKVAYPVESFIVWLEARVKGKSLQNPSGKQRGKK